MKYYLPAIIWGAIIFYLSTRGSIQLPSSWWDFIAVDKVGHLVFYMIFGIFIMLGQTKNRKLPLTQIAAIGALIFGAAYGTGLEFIQYYFFPNRYFEFQDMFANITGSLLGWYIFKRFIL